MDDSEIGFADEAAPHRGLVGYHHHSRARAPDLTQAFQRLWQKLELGPRFDVVDSAPVDDPIAI
jgi:hypothetical protein